MVKKITISFLFFWVAIVETTGQKKNLSKPVVYPYSNTAVRIIKGLSDSALLDLVQ